MTSIIYLERNFILNLMKKFHYIIKIKEIQIRKLTVLIKNNLQLLILNKMIQY